MRVADWYIIFAEFRGSLSMSYVVHVLQPGERLILTGRLHWIGYWRGLIARHTAEINMDKVETVQVEQSLFGRIFDYGIVSIKGSGASIETLRDVAEPIAPRSAITAR